MKTYLGDGVYVEPDGRDLVLTTENGVRVTNRIVLELQVWDALLALVMRHTPDQEGPCSRSSSR